MPRWICGIHPVRELLAGSPGKIEILLLKKDPKGKALKELEALAAEAHVEVRNVDGGELSRIRPDARHQGAIARVADFSYADFDAWLSTLSRGNPPPDVLVLDRVQDPQNLGALMRSAETFALGGIVIPRNRSVPVTDAVVRASAGASELVPVCRVVNLVRALDSLKKAGYWIIGSDPEAATSLFDADLTGLCAFVLGGESEGMRRLVRSRCDLIVSLPRLGRIASLNVSVAGGILMAEAARQKRAYD